MSNETEKALRRLATDPLWGRVSKIPKPWLDVGCGDCPLSGADPYDTAQGDANFLEGVPDAYYYLVWSSHCLEHMRDPERSLDIWWGKVKPGGYLWLELPDAKLYEHGHWPSRYNSDHKSMFSAFRARPMGTDRHYNLVDLLWNLRDAELMRLCLVDTNYNYHDIRSDQTILPDTEAGIEMVVRKCK